MKIKTNDVEKSRMELVNTSYRRIFNWGRNQKVVRKELSSRKFSLKTGRKLCSQKRCRFHPLSGSALPSFDKNVPPCGGGAGWGTTKLWGSPLDLLRLFVRFCVEIRRFFSLDSTWKDENGSQRGGNGSQRLLLHFVGIYLINKPIHPNLVISSYSSIELFLRKHKK